MLSGMFTRYFGVKQTIEQTNKSKQSMYDRESSTMLSRAFIRVFDVKQTVEQTEANKQTMYEQDS